MATWGPVSASSLEDMDEEVGASRVEPAAGSEVDIPADFFLENLKSGPTLADTLADIFVDDLRGLRGSIARALRTLKSDEVDPGVEVERHSAAPVLDVAEELGGEDPVGYDRSRELAERIRGADATRPEITLRAALAAQDIWIKDSPTLNTDFAGATSAAPSLSGPPQATVTLDARDARPSWVVLDIAADVLLWIRNQPLFTFLAISLLGFLLWMRHAAHRTE
jgi:hypothetical protein